MPFSEFSVQATMRGEHQLHRRSIFRYSIDPHEVSPPLAPHVSSCAGVGRLQTFFGRSWRDQYLPVSSLKNVEKPKHASACPRLHDGILHLHPAKTKTQHIALLPISSSNAHHQLHEAPRMLSIKFMQHHMALKEFADFIPHSDE